MKCFVAVACAIMISLPANLEAQGASAAAREFFAAHAKQDFVAMANLIDTSVNRLVRAKANEVIEQVEERTAQMNRGDPVRMSALMPMMEKLMTSMLGAEFARTKSADELKQLSDSDLLARWLEAKSARYQVGNAGNIIGGLAGLSDMVGLSSGGGAAGAQRELDSMAVAVANVRLDWQVLGEVADGNTTVPVTYRVAGMTPAATSGALTFRRSGTQWKVFVNSLEDDDQLSTLAGLEMAAVQTKIGGE
jgi:hypothetical protein